MNETIINKINSFFSDSLEKTVSNILIIQNEKGDYELFNKYLIQKSKGHIIVQPKYTFTTKKFSNLPVAVSWCIFDKRNKIIEANRIEYLDEMLLGLKYNITLHENILKTSHNKESKLIALAKLSDELHKKNTLYKELLEFINDSKNYQLRQFSQK